MEDPAIVAEPTTQDAFKKTNGESADPNYKWKVLGTVIFGIFMVILDTTVVNVAFQTIREQFGGNINDSQWVISIYVLSLGISTPLAGFLADRFGEKKIYLGGLGLFAAGSLLCGLAPNLPLLIAARAIQGIGGGIAMPLGMALLLQAFPYKEQGMALGIFGIAALVAPAIGPILGGFLVVQGVWRVIFFINPPIGLLGVILGIRFLRENRYETVPPFDAVGVITEVVGFGAMLYAASIAASQGWTSPNTLMWFGIGLLGLIAFGINELFYAREPLLDLRLYKNRIFLNASLLGYVSTVALFGAEFLLPIYLQTLRGQTALQTGFILLPMALSGGIFVTLSGRLYDKVGPRPLMVAGFVLLLVNTWQLASIQANTPISWIIFLLVLRGVALGLTVQTTMVTALSVVPKPRLARGSSLTNATRNVIQSIGVAILATVLASALTPQIKNLQDQFQAKPAANTQPFALCQFGAAQSPVAIPDTGTADPPSSGLFSSNGQVTIPPQAVPIIQEACRESISGFESAYKLTFYFALVALILGALLPGWPGKWEGRQGPKPPMAH